MQKPTIFLALLMLATAPAAGETGISGFVDTSYFLDKAAQNGEFGLDQVELDIFHQTSDRSAVVADIEWVKDGETFVARIEQGYVSSRLPGQWDFRFGKFNAPIGFELLDAPDMYQFSHALVFDFGLPTNLTGASVARPLGKAFDFIGYVCNGWDANAMAGSNATWGGRLGHTRGDFGAGISMISGTQDLDLGGPGPVPVERTVLDIDLTYAPAGWVLGGEYNRGGATSGGVDREWSSLLLVANRSLGERTGLTFRFETFSDPDGWIFNAAGGETRRIFTISPSRVLDENFAALVELRIDKSDVDSFLDADGAPTDTQTTLAFEMTYSW